MVNADRGLGPRTRRVLSSSVQVLHRLLFDEGSRRLRVDMNSQALLPATDEMRDCCSLLSTEMLHWPGVKMYHLFGTCAFYHRKVMFAMLPDKRSLDGARAISFKTSAMNSSDPQDQWQRFELTNRTMVGAALESLAKAYQESMQASAFPEMAVSS